MLKNTGKFQSTRVYPKFSVGFMLLDFLFSVQCFADLSFSPFSFGHCVICPLIYDFFLLFLYLRFTTSSYSFCILDLRLLVTPFVSQIYDFLLLFLYLRYTTSCYSFCILDLRLLVTPFVSQIYDFLLPLLYLRYTTSCYPFCILDL